MKFFNDGYLMANAAGFLAVLGLYLIHPGLSLIGLGVVAGAVAYYQHKGAQVK